jgi:hypothetical protein
LLPRHLRGSSVAAAGCAGGSGTYTALTTSYRMVLRIGMAEAMYTPAQVKTKHPTSGEVMVGGSMMSSGAMSMHGTRHLEVQICNRSTGAVITNASPTITIVESSTNMMTTKVPVAMMRGVDAGMGDIHYGNNVAISAGHAFIVKVTLKSEQAVFHVHAL